MNKEKIITYKITDEWGDAITKKELRTMKKFLGPFTLETNAGLDIHSSEMENGMWNGITIKRVSLCKTI